MPPQPGFGTRSWGSYGYAYYIGKHPESILERCPDAEGPLRAWHSEIKQAAYQNPNEVISDYPMADTVKNNRVVFNICHNKYRLIVTFRYKYKRVYIRFIGTHKEYEAIEDIPNI